MRLSKRILSIILALFIFCFLMSSTVSAVTTVSADTKKTDTSGTFQYKILDDGTIEITDYFKMTKEFVIPSIIDGYTVSVIGEFAFEYAGAENIIIQEGIKKIDSYAFYRCESLKKVKIPGSVKNIGVAAFSSCFGLGEVIIENGVEAIDEYAFYYCTCLFKVIIPESLTSIGNSAFLNCYSLTNIVIPANVPMYSWGLGYYVDEVTSNRVKFDNFTIYGYPGTGADWYAKGDFLFIPLDKGDADESTSLDIKDVTCMQKIIAKITATNDFKTANCDLNGDGKLNIRDATLLQLYLANKIDKFPVQE